ncbi:NAD(P)-dependent oxidoreductase [Thermocatellispora tengchongensis]|uniref:NAD(P)-dependent oxidoreductase n=1 Tax=Thermocatellispora tengchongensis TaxID=1073253 RepID=UPI003644046A
MVGASRIGRHVLRRLRRFDVEVLLYDPYVNAAEAARLGAEPVGLDDLCRRSHLVTVHAPALPETRHMLDARRLDLLPENAVVVNTARGSLIDTQALTRACATGRISAILDVTDPEPLPPGHPLLAMPNVLVTPTWPARRAASCAASAISPSRRWIACSTAHHWSAASSRSTSRTSPDQVVLGGAPAGGAPEAAHTYPRHVLTGVLSLPPPGRGGRTRVAPRRRARAPRTARSGRRVRVRQRTRRSWCVRATPAAGGRRRPGRGRNRTGPRPGGRAARVGSRRSRGTCASTSRWSRSASRA